MSRRYHHGSRSGRRQLLYRTRTIPVTAMASQEEHLSALGVETAIMDQCPLPCSAGSAKTFTRILPCLCVLSRVNSDALQSEVPKNRLCRSVSLGSMMPTWKKVSVPASRAIPEPRQLNARMQYLGLATGFREGCLYFTMWRLGLRLEIAETPIFWAAHQSDWPIFQIIEIPR
jgi:hypothetical protein